MDKEQLKEVLEKHKLWILEDEGGERADLSGADLSDANLSGADLSGANLRDADLRWADLSGANLSFANLGAADLGAADLRGADLSGANLSGANLSGANLSRAYLRDADLRGARGNKREVKNFQFSAYNVVIAVDTAFVGCETHSIDDWLSFDEDRIRQMDGKQAVTFYKNILKPMLILHTKGLL